MNGKFFREVLVSALLIAALLGSAGRAGWSDDDTLPVSSSLSEQMTLIIDAGHGGLDGGAVSLTGRRESELNLEISNRIADLAAFLGREPLMTRSTEELVYPEEAATIRAKKVADQRARVALVNAQANPVLLSIHQNQFTTPKPSGAQVYYSAGAEDLAQRINDNFLTNKVGKKSTPDQISADIYLFKKVNCPAVLVECGFLSNPEEAEKLETESYQKKLAVMIAGAVVSELNS